MKNMFYKILMPLSLAAVMCIFAACSSGDAPSGDKVYYTSDGQKITIGEGNLSGGSNQNPENFKSPLNKPSSTDKRLEPDLSKVKPKAASKSVADTSTEEKLVEALESFTNPNGNKYDAMAILGSFGYTEDEEALYARFDEASKSWHELVESMVGEKCIVDISIKSKGDNSNTEEKFAEWQRVHGGIGEDYTNLKCVIKSNYSSSSVTYSLDIVKVKGKWHIANAGALDKIQMILINDLFR